MEDRRFNAPEAAGEPTGDWVETTLRVVENAIFETAEGGSLELEPGAHEIAFHFEHSPERDPEVDYPICHLLLQDVDDDWWLTRTFLDAILFLEPVLSPNPAADSEIFFWRDVPEAWRQAMRDDCLISGVRTLYDDRNRFELKVGEETITMMNKHQGASIDVAWLESESMLVVRPSEMYFEEWRDGERVDTVDQVSFGYLLDPSKVLLPTNPDRHWALWEQRDDRGEDPVVRPVFSRLE